MSTTAGYSRKPASTAKGRSAPVQAQVRDACVLVVEDHEDTRLMLRTILELRGGISVVEAENGEIAIALAERLHPDLILMDTDLPLLDGYMATRRIRQLTSTREVPIIFLSGHAQPVAQAKAFDAGCTDYLVKPFALGEMERVIERHLSQRKAN
jgi:CheY-like chemotaxis protein